MAGRGNRPSWAEENDDIVRGYRWVAALDCITCIGCAVRDGLRYDVNFIPVGHAIPWGDGPGKRHKRCRCTMVPVLDPEYEKYTLGATRPAVVGRKVQHVSAAEPYSVWIKKQSPSFQNEVLGALRGKLFRDFRLDLVDLVNGEGNPLSYPDLLTKFTR